MRVLNKFSHIKTLHWTTSSLTNTVSTFRIPLKVTIFVIFVEFETVFIPLRKAIQQITVSLRKITDFLI